MSGCGFHRLISWKSGLSAKVCATAGALSSLKCPVTHWRNSSALSSGNSLAAPSRYGWVRNGLTSKGSGDDSAKMVSVVLGRAAWRIPNSYITFALPVVRSATANSQISSRSNIALWMMPPSFSSSARTGNMSAAWMPGLIAFS